MSTTPTAQAYIAAITAEGKVCPQPEKWIQLWQQLPNRRQIGTKWEPSPPLILAAWHHTTDIEKRERLSIHLRWAEDHQYLPQALAFLYALTPEEWHTRTD